MPTKQEKLRNEYPNAWIPVEDGDSLEGTVLEVTRAWSDQRNGFYPLLQVETSDNQILNFHAFGDVSFDRVMEKKPLPGEHIVITYRGLGKEKPGRNAPKIFHITLPERDPEAAANAIYGQLQSPRGGTDPVEEES